jgi:protein-disulfide isomerase
VLKRLVLLVFGLALLQLSGCKADKKIYEEIEALKARIAALEKMLQPPKEEPQVQSSAYDIPVDNSYVFGNKDAPVHIFVFSNFQCPYCAKADKALRELLKDETLKSKVNIVFKHFPFERHPEARPAAKVALAAGEQGKFWEMTEKIFSHQDAMNKANYEKWAKEIGVDVAKLNKDLADKDKAYNDLIDRDIKLGAETAKLEGTPWILVGGWLLDGPITADNIKNIINNKKL